MSDLDQLADAGRALMALDRILRRHHHDVALASVNVRPTASGRPLISVVLRAGQPPAAGGSGTSLGKSLQAEWGLGQPAALPGMPEHITWPPYEVAGCLVRVSARLATRQARALAAGAQS